jgi:hypothetical protein
MDVKRGDKVVAVNALGQHVERVALTGVLAGHDFMVIWVCKPEEWEAAQKEGREPEGMPYPQEDVHVAATA